MASPPTSRPLPIALRKPNAVGWPTPTASLPGRLDDLRCALPKRLLAGPRPAPPRRPVRLVAVARTTTGERSERAEHPLQHAPLAAESGGRQASTRSPMRTPPPDLPRVVRRPASGRQQAPAPKGVQSSGHVPARELREYFASAHAVLFSFDELLVWLVCHNVEAVSQSLVHEAHSCACRRERAPPQTQSASYGRCSPPPVPPRYAALITH